MKKAESLIKLVVIGLIIMVGVICNFDIKIRAKNNTYKCISTTRENVKIKGIRFSYKYSETSSKIYFTKNNVKHVLYSMEGLDSSILTDGETVYFAVNDWAKNTVNVYRGDYNGSKEMVFTVKADDFCLSGYYDNCIYYIRGIDPGVLCRYNLSSGETKIIDSETTSVSQKNNYFCLSPYMGDPSGGPLKIFNAKNGQKYKISNKVVIYRVSGNKIYYLEETGKYISSVRSFIIKSCNMSGKAKKTIGKKFKAYEGSIKFTSKYVVYKAKFQSKKVKKLRYR